MVVRDCAECKLRCPEHANVTNRAGDLETKVQVDKTKFDFLKLEVNDMRAEQSELMKSVVKLEGTLNKAIWVVLGATSVISIIYTFHESISKVIGIIK